MPCHFASSLHVHADMHRASQRGTGPPPPARFHPAPFPPPPQSPTPTRAHGSAETGTGAARPTCVAEVVKFRLLLHVPAAVLLRVGGVGAAAAPREARHGAHGVALGAVAPPVGAFVVVVACKDARSVLQSLGVVWINA